MIWDLRRRDLQYAWGFGKSLPDMIPASFQWMFCGLHHPKDLCMYHSIMFFGGQCSIHLYWAIQSDLTLNRALYRLGAPGFLTWKSVD